MSSSCRIVSMGSVVCVAPLILSLWLCVGEAVPLGFGILSSFFDAENITAVLADLALAHIEHKLDKLSALAEFASLLANVTGTAFIG